MNIFIEILSITKLNNLLDNDLIIISDVDEIPDPSKLKLIKNGTIVVDTGISLVQDLYYYNINCYISKWNLSKIVTYKEYCKTTPQQIRLTNYVNQDNMGWHLSYFGDAHFISNKIKEFSHQEYNNDTYTSLESISNVMNNCKDVYNRPEVLLKHISLENNTYLPPKYLNLPLQKK